MSSSVTLLIFVSLFWSSTLPLHLMFWISKWSVFRSAAVWIWNSRIELFKKFKHRAGSPRILTSCCTVSHNFGIISTYARFRQANMGCVSSLAINPYENNLVIVSIVFITSLCHFWSVLSSFLTLPGRHRADPSTDEDVPCVELPMPNTVWYLVHVHRRPLLTRN